MPSVVFIVPGRLSTLTGGSIYDRRMVEGLRQRGWSVLVRELDGSFPQPRADALDQASAVLAALPDGMTVIVDGLVLGAIPSLVSPHARRLRIVALVHLPLADEVGLDTDSRRRLEASERCALALSAGVVVTGRSTVGAIAGYGVQPERIILVEPGTDAAPVARGSGSATLQLLSVATLSPGKGHEDLVRALSANRDRQWELTCVGSVTRYPADAERLRRLLIAEGLDARVVLAGEFDREALAACYDRSDLFVLATRRETFGMAVAEALAHGLPVVSTRTGSIPELVGEEAAPDAAGLIVTPGDVGALTVALSRALDDPGLRVGWRAGARRARQRIHTWDTAVTRMIEALMVFKPA
jgi:glycosyltransferase involved in cell wall biosynthesis